MPITRAYAQAAEPGNFFVAGKNKIINGDFGIWQRSTSATVTTEDYMAADRFRTVYVAGGATTTWSRQAFTAGTAPAAPYESQYFSRISSTSGSGTTVIGIHHRIEDARTLSNQTVTFSFWAKGDSARTITILGLQRFGTGGSSDVTILSQTFTVSTSWTRYTYTFSNPSVSGKTIASDSWVGFYVYYNTGQASGSPQLDLWGWQFETGAVATPFQTASGSLGGELALCQRYYQKSYEQGTAPGSNTTNGAIDYAVGSFVTSALGYGVILPVTMRTAPTMTPYDNVGNSGKVYRGGSNKTASFVYISNNGGSVYCSDTTSSIEMIFQYTASAEL